MTVKAQIARLPGAMLAAIPAFIDVNRISNLEETKSIGADSHKKRRFN
jgi:hypothetical protein